MILSWIWDFLQLVFPLHLGARSHAVRARARACRTPHVVVDRLVLDGHLDAVGQEAEDGADPEQDGESAEQLTTELDPLRGGGWRGQGVGSVPGQHLQSSGTGKTLRMELMSFCLCEESYYDAAASFSPWPKERFYCYGCGTSSFPGLFNTGSIIN